MKCPKCGGLFIQALLEDIQIDRCNSCNGLWFDELELKAVLNKKGSEKLDTGTKSDYERTSKIEDIFCPKDNSKMIKMVDVKQNHIWFESCGVCRGIFLDATELKDLKEYSLFDIVKSILVSGREG